MRKIIMALALALFANCAHADPANDDITESGHAFVGSAVSELGLRSFVQLWNPADSSRDLWVDKIVVANSQSAKSSAADLRPSTSAIGTLHLHGFNRLLGGGASRAEIRAGNIASLPLVNGRMHEMWLSGTYAEREYVFNPAIKVQPGHGLLVAQWVPDEKTIVSWHWRETESLAPPHEGPFGNMPMGGGLSAAFDGAVSKTLVMSACTVTPSGEPAYIGKGNLTTPLAVSSVRIHPTSDEGFDGNDGSLTFELYGSHVAPGDSADGVLLGSLAGQADMTGGHKEVVSSDQATAWEFIWVRIFSPDAGNHTYCTAQVETIAP